MRYLTSVLGSASGWDEHEFHLKNVLHICSCKCKSPPMEDEVKPNDSLCSHPGEQEDYYVMLGVEKTASPEEIKRAYRRYQIKMHPDKLAQRGQTVTDADRDRIHEMGIAYATLSDSYKRECYDNLGLKMYLKVFSDKNLY